MKNKLAKLLNCCQTLCKFIIAVLGYRKHFCLFAEIRNFSEDFEGFNGKEFEACTVQRLEVLE